MDHRRNLIISGDIPAELGSDTSASPARQICEGFVPQQIMETDEGDNISLQWLSIFMEDCLSSTTSFTSPIPSMSNSDKTRSTNPFSSQFEDLSAPSNTRNKRNKTPGGSKIVTFSTEPSLLHQTHWLAESELLIVPGMQKESKRKRKDGHGGNKGRQMLQAKRCSHCLSQKTPQWRAGPLGPKTLCNACGVRFKSGRLLPEYRPAKSPTFVSCKHSNSHKKVMEMRMAVFSSNSD